MWKEDAASRAAGMMLDKVGPGYAMVSMKVGVNMVNGHGFCHGGFIFMLADSAFGFACNSYGERNVGQSCQITYLAPARLGTRMVAEARERYRADRSGIYDVTVKSEAGEVLAEFRGFSRTIAGNLVRGG
jgi:acyl-CoA thioesterase